MNEVKSKAVGLTHAIGICSYHFEERKGRKGKAHAPAIVNLASDHGDDIHGISWNVVELARVHVRDNRDCDLVASRGARGMLDLLGVGFEVQYFGREQ